jgi:hypothetical protein
VSPTVSAKAVKKPTVLVLFRKQAFFEFTTASAMKKANDENHKRYDIVTRNITRFDEKEFDWTNVNVLVVDFDDELMPFLQPQFDAIPSIVVYATGDERGQDWARDGMRTTHSVLFQPTLKTMSVALHEVVDDALKA